MDGRLLLVKLEPSYQLTIWHISIYYRQTWCAHAEELWQPSKQSNHRTPKM
jgi:hypothetical protein